MSLERGFCASQQRSETKLLIVDFVSARSCKFCENLNSDYKSDHVSSLDELAYILDGEVYPIAVLANSASPDGKADFSSDLRAAETIHKVQSACQLLFLVRQNLAIEDCCQAVKLGAAGFVNVEQNQDELAAELNERIDELLAKWRDERNQLRSMQQSDLFDRTGIATQSKNMLRLLAQARKAANVCDAPIVIEGESGTGKQLISEAIHKMDPKRCGCPFISVNCAAITGSLAESALFGHKKGAFTGATEDRPGYFRAADGGTLLLDEISELESSLQPKLLRVLQEGKVLPVGDDHEHSINVRTIAASNKPLAEQVAEGKFRLDLYQRLNVIKLHVPALRERIEDIPLLVRTFLDKYEHYYSEHIDQVESAVYKVLQRALWQGNVRELENIVRQTLVFKAVGSTFTVADLPEHVRASSVTAPDDTLMPVDQADYIMKLLNDGPVDLSRVIEDYECEILRTAIGDMGLRGTKLARYLTLNRRTLYHKLHKHQLLDPS